LKNSLGGNNKTCIILCISPAKCQFEHSLNTLKFGVNARKIENKTSKNIITNNSEETLKLLIQEYHSRLLQIGENNMGQNYNNENMQEIEDLKKENKILLEKLNEKEYKELKETKKIYFSFNLNEKNNLISSIPEEFNAQFHNDIITNLLEILKIKTEQLKIVNQTLENSGLLNASENLLTTLKKQAEFIESIKKEISERNSHMEKLKEIVQDHLKILKAQAAKLEVYENIEKWIQMINISEKNTLINNFENIIRKLKDPINSNEIIISKLLPSTIIYSVIAKLSGISKIGINTKFDEFYVNSLLSKKYEEIKFDIIKIPEIKEFSNINFIESEKLAIECLQKFKESLPKNASYHTPSPPKSNRSKKSERSKSDIIDSPQNKPNPARLTLSSQAKKRSPNPPLNRNKTPMSRSTSSCSKQPFAKSKSGLDLLKQVESQQNSQKTLLRKTNNKTPQPKPTASQPTRRISPIKKSTTIKVPQKYATSRNLYNSTKKNKTMEIEWVEKNSEVFDEIDKLAKNIIEMTKPAQKENSNKLEVKNLQEIVNKMYNL